jgi:hypothetical protein
MPDPQTQTDPSQQGALSGQPAGISGGTGFFSSLVGTLVKGAVQGGVQALAQNQSNPYTRSMAAGINAPQIAQQRQAQQSEQADEATLRKQRIAMGQLYELQTKHLLAKADQETRNSVYNTARDFHDQLDRQGMIDWVGGTNKDPAALRQELSKQKAAHPDQDVRIVPKGGTTADSPLYQIAIVRKGGIPKDINLSGVAGTGKLPSMPVNISAGTEASDASVAGTHAVRNGVSQNIQSQNSKPLSTNSSMISSADLEKAVENSGYPPIKNMANVYAYATEGDASGLGSKTTRGRDGVELGKDDAEEFIRDSGMFPGFNPQQAAADKDTVKRLEDYYKGGQMKDWESANNAALFASDTLASNPKNPKVRELAQALSLRAPEIRSQYPTPKEKAAAGASDKADRFTETVRQKALVPINHTIEQDQGKFQDFAEAINLLNKGGGEYDAVAKIAALRGTVGGGGVRITGAELNSIGSQARGWMGDVETWFSRADDKTVQQLTPLQRTQLKDILNNAYKLLAAKNDAYADASDKILGASSIQEIHDAQRGLTHNLRAPKMPQEAVAPPSGKTVSMKAARQLPQNQGKTDDQIKQDIQAHGHTAVD